jgi:hypothetical protein
MEPVRVKIYGLFSRTRKRYLTDAALGLSALVGVLIAWFFLWPNLRNRIEEGRQHLEPPVLPLWMQITVVVLEVLPWILTATAVFKCLEMFLVLRCFARKEDEKSRQGTGPQSSGPA